ncbi:hypothetical protein BCU32_024420 [Vibrio lentus]|uniref:hypothetical protein n=1 Tax=Vibrio lentus TaxID=136468 RepID=UPI0039A5FAC2
MSDPLVAGMLNGNRNRERRGPMAAVARDLSGLSNAEYRVQVTGENSENIGGSETGAWLRDLT